ncbi:MAG: hypothetical protein QXP01_00920 [Candidatus Hadarchaeum sp.]
MQGAREELGEILAWGDLAPHIRPSDPTLSEWVATTMVLAFRQALLGQGLRPCWLLHVGANGQERELAIREEPVAIRPSCPLCRPEASGLVREPPAPGGSEEAVPAPASWRKRLERWGVTLATWSAGLAGFVVGLGLVFALLLAVREMVGFRNHYGVLPNLGELLWRFGSWRFNHSAWHYFGLIPGALLFLSFPYLLLVFPFRCARRTHRNLVTKLVQRRVRGGLPVGLRGLGELLGQDNLSPSFRLSPKTVGTLLTVAHGFAALTEAAALLLFALFKSWGGEVWLVLMFSVVPLLLILGGIVSGLRYNHRTLRSSILRLYML